MNDWRTDNWAGHYPVHSDPRNYRFARHLREFDHYATYNFDGPGHSVEDNSTHVFRTLIFLVIILSILANLDIIIDVLTHFQSYYTMWVDGLLQMRQDLQ